MAFISVRVLFSSGFIELADLICLSGVRRPKFLLLLFVIKSVSFNSFSRLSKKKSKRAKGREKSEQELHVLEF